MIRRKIFVSVLIITSNLFVLLSCYAATLNESQLKAFRSAKTVRILVEESYGEAKGVSLPFENLAQRLLEYAGLKIVRYVKDYDVTLKIQAEGTAVPTQYYDEHGLRAGYYYSGAYLSGKIILEIPSIPEYKKSFSGYKSHALKIPFGSFSTPSSAPFQDAFITSNFFTNLLDIIGEVYGFKFCVAALEDNNWQIRRAAAEVLGKVKETNAVEPLIATLRDRDINVRSMAANALGKIRDPRAVGPLGSILKEDEDWYTRSIAAEALGEIPQIEGSRAILLLIAALKDEGKSEFVDLASLFKQYQKPNEPIPIFEDSVQKSAAEALVKIGTPAVEPLIDALKEKDIKNIKVREKACELLGKIKDARAVEPLIVALGDKYMGVQKKAAEALGEIRNALAIESLIIALGKKDTEVQKIVIEALGKIGTQAVEPLIAATKDKTSKVREGAADALGKIKETRAVEPLIIVLKKDEDIWVRVAAAKALGEIRDSRAVETLIAAIGDKFGNIKGAAAQALEKITEALGNRQNFGEDSVKWRKWWKENKTKYETK